MINKSNDIDIYWMKQAIELANVVLFDTLPNPRVGCIIINNGFCIGKGATQPVGGLHAEILAVNDALTNGQSLLNSTIYVTLEPCCHYGFTPPCVDTLIKYKPKRIVIALLDPNPKVNGKSVKILRNAGIYVDIGVCFLEALNINIGFVSNHLRKRPWVWSKIAMSMDGFCALKNGQSKWITGVESRSDGHQWRARSSAVMTGIGTIISDNPILNTRYKTNTLRQPIKVVLDSNMSIPENSLIFDGCQVIIFTSKIDKEKIKKLADKNVSVICLPDIHGKQVDLNKMFDWLHIHNYHEIHLESGSILNSALLCCGMIDDIILYIAPKFFGSGINIFNMLKIDSLSNAEKFSFLDMVSIGSDIRIRLRSNESWNQIYKLFLKYHNNYNN